MATSKWYVADFETTGVDFYNQYGYTKVWLYAICDSDANIIFKGSSIEEFMVDLHKLTGSIVYFHNLKFDGTFILDYMLNNGYLYDDDISNKNNTFNCLIGDMGQWYAMNINFSGHRQVKIHDSLKLLPFKVEKIAEDFNLPIKKGKINYNDYTIDDEKLEYVYHDVQVVAMALKIIKEEGMQKMTTAGCAYSIFKDMRGDRYMKFNFPTLDKEFLKSWRSAYRGGRSQVNPFFKGLILNNIKRYDINSMYPWVMYTQPLPYGLPIKTDKINQYKFELYHIRVEFYLKQDSLPTLLKKGHYSFLEDSYYVSTDGIEEIWISNIDFELLQRHYDIRYCEFLEIYGFHTSTELFKPYIDKWYARKQVDKGAQKIVDKLMLNSLYGKFGSNIEGYHKIPILDNDIITYKNSELEQMRAYYLPIAIAVTSYAHRRIDDGICDVGINNFVYCDTDSIHTRTYLSSEYVDAKRLGYYKLEAIEDKSKYVRQKTYMYHTEEEGLKIVCAGMPDNMKEKLILEYGDSLYDIFSEGMTVSGKLLPKRVKGGTILYETTFKIRS